MDPNNSEAAATESKHIDEEAGLGPDNGRISNSWEFREKDVASTTRIVEKDGFTINKRSWRDEISTA